MTHELYILDACALIAFLNCENGAQIVLNLLEKAENNEVKILSLLSAFHEQSILHNRSYLHYKPFEFFITLLIIKILLICPS